MKNEMSALFVYDAGKRYKSFLNLVPKYSNKRNNRNEIIQIATAKIMTDAKHNGLDMDIPNGNQQNKMHIARSEFIWNLMNN